MSDFEVVKNILESKYEFGDEYLKWGKELLDNLPKMGLDGCREFENDTFQIAPYDWDGLSDCSCGLELEKDRLYDNGASDEELEQYENTHMHDIDCSCHYTNFYHKPTGIKIEWRKHVERFEAINKEITYKQWKEIVQDCVKSVLKNNSINNDLVKGENKMKKLEIPVKFQKEDTIYTIKKVKIEANCPICEGKGKIKYNDKDMKCPECMGRGKFTSNKQINIVCDEPYIISTTKISVNSNGGITVKYKGRCGTTTLNRSEENLFLTREEAQAKCDELNKEKIFLNIEDIVISEDFKTTQPSIDKIQTKLDYYKNNKKFEKDIVINKENTLQNGYITYLLCKLLNIDVVKVVVEDVA